MTKANEEEKETPSIEPLDDESDESPDTSNKMVAYANATDLTVPTPIFQKLDQSTRDKIITARRQVREEMKSQAKNMSEANNTPDTSSARKVNLTSQESEENTSVILPESEQE